MKEEIDVEEVGGILSRSLPEHMSTVDRFRVLRWAYENARDALQAERAAIAQALDEPTAPKPARKTRADKGRPRIGKRLDGQDGEA
jgi:hypothetical protein